MRILGQDRQTIVFTEGIDTIAVIEANKEFQLNSYNGDEENYTSLGLFSSEQQVTDVIREIFENASGRYIIPEDAGEDYEA